MKITTRQFGEIEFEESKIIYFNEGIIGFENLKRFILINQEESLFYWLTNIDEPEMVFPLIPSKILIDDYPDIENHQAFAIVKLNREPIKITANLKAPLYINNETNTGKQEIIDDDKYPLDYKVFIEKED